MPEQDERQFHLLPNEPLHSDAMQVDLGSLEWQPMSYPVAFRESVRRMGVLQSIAVVQKPGRVASFIVADGRRRCSALKEIAGDNWRSVRIAALIFPVGTPRHVAAAIALAANVQRSSNPVSEYYEIAMMMQAGATEADIASQLHLPIATIRKRMRLSMLSGEMRNAVEAGLIAPSVAMQITRLDQPRVAALVARLEANGRLTARDVHEVREVQHTDQIEALPESLFERVMPAVEQAAQALAAVLPPEEESWATVVTLLERAERAVPIAPDDDVEGWYQVFAYLLERARGMSHSTQGA